MSTRVLEAVNAHLRERSTGLIETFMAYDVAKIEECRRLVQSLINAESPDRIALMMNTSDPINVLASGLQWKSGDRVLLHEDEFPANVWPYMALKRHGVEIDVLSRKDGHATPQLIADAITGRTRVVALSAVQFLTGYRSDLEKIGSLCRDKNIILAVDGIQAVGAVRLDVQRMKIDMLAAGCQKWQLGMQGTSWMYVSEELQSRIQTAHVGWLAVADPWDFFNYDQPLAATARRYEGGTKNIPGLWGMAAALSMLLEFGLEKIEGHILGLTQELIEGLLTLDAVEMITPVHPAERAGIVTVALPEWVDAKQVFKRLAAGNLTVSLREGKLRYAPHFYNTAAEIDLTVAATRDAIHNEP
jgi:cysteine desulfurase/selenocysteine lyase